MKKNAELLLVYIAAFLFFLLTLAENFSGPHDSIRYLNGLVTGTELVNQHHLLYHLTAYHWLNLVHPLFPGVKDYYIVETFTALCGSASLTVVYAFFRNRFHLPVLHAVGGICVVACTYGIWFYSVNIEVYGPPIFLLLLALYIICRPSFTRTDALIVSLLHCLAVLYHQINILFFVVVFYQFWTARKRLPFLQLSAMYVLVGIVIVGGTYFYMGWYHEGNNSLTSWIRWMEGYAKDDSYWQALSWQTPLHVGYGFGHAFFGGHFIFQVDVVSNYLDRTLAAHSLQDEMYIARNISETMAILLSILTLVVIVTMVTLVVRFWRRYKSIRRTFPGVTEPLLLCGLVYSAFFTFWIPEILEFWLLQSVLIWLLLIGTLPVTKFPFKLSNTAGTWLLAVLLFTINYFGSIRWLRDIRNDWYYAEVMPVKDEATHNDIILLRDAWLLKDFLHYYTPALPISIEDSSSVILNSYVTECLNRKGRVFIYPAPNRSNTPSDPRYLDSLVSAYSGRVRVFHEAAPRVLLIQ